MIRITTDVFCDKCGNWTHGTTSNKVEIREARANAKKSGWSFQANALYSDVCPTCLAESRRSS